MLAVSVDTDWDVVKQFYKAHNLTIPAALDPGHQISGLYKVFKFPETFLIDGNGYVVRHTWSEHWANPRVISLVDSLIQQQEAKHQRRKYAHSEYDDQRHVARPQYR